MNHLELSKNEIINRKISLPILNTEGVYFLIYENEIMYIGSSKSVEQRVVCHVSGKTIPIDCYYWIACKNYKVIEAQYILKFNPKYNFNIGQKFLHELNYISLNKIKIIAKNVSKRYNQHEHRDLALSIKRKEKLCLINSIILHSSSSKIYLIKEILKIANDFYNSKQNGKAKYKFFLEELEKKSI